MKARTRPCCPQYTCRHPAAIQLRPVPPAGTRCRGPPRAGCLARQGGRRGGLSGRWHCIWILQPCCPPSLTTPCWPMNVSCCRATIWAAATQCTGGQAVPAFCASIPTSCSAADMSVPAAHWIRYSGWSKRASIRRVSRCWASSSCTSPRRQA